MDLNNYRLNAYLKTAGKGEQNSEDSRTSVDGQKKIKKPVFEKIQRSSLEPFVQTAQFPHFEKQTVKQPDKLEKTAKNYDSSDEVQKAASALTSHGLIKVPRTASEGGTDSVYRRVAKFFLIIGVDEASKILPHLTQEQTEKIIPEIASIRSVSQEEAIAILAEFQSLVQRAKEGGGIETARTILSKAFGSQRASQILDKTVKPPKCKPFEYLAEIDNSKLMILLKDELPAIKALVISYLKPKKAAALINLMSEEDKKETIMRLAKMAPISPEVLERVDNAMHEKINSIDMTKDNQIDGRQALVQILKKMDLQSENDILNKLSQEDPDLSRKLKKDLFTIEDIINCDDRYLQNILAEMPDSDIALLIAGKNQEFRTKILQNISKNRSDTIMEEEQLQKPVLRSESERITAIFMTRMRKAFEDGKYIIKGRTDDIYI